MKGGKRELDILNWMTRTALELVGQGGLGHSFDSLDSDGLNPFAEELKALMYVLVMTSYVSFFMLSEFFLAQPLRRCSLY